MPLKLGNISRLTLGVQGDNASGPIRIDVSEWLSQWPDGIITVWNLRHGTTESYPVATTVEDGILTWSPTSADTQYEGAGLCRFTVTEDGIVKNSVYIPTKVFPGLPGTTSSDPPDPYAPWVTQVLTAAEQIVTAINDKLDKTGIVVDTFTGSLASESDDPTITTTVEKTGYTPIMAVCQNTSSADVYCYRCNISGNNVQASFRKNDHSSITELNPVFCVLYKEN